MSNLSGAAARERDQIGASIDDMVWVPNPGPQTDAYFSEADELLYGGEAGGGKTDLLIGLGLTAHQSSLILRRVKADVESLEERLTDIVGSSAGLNTQKHRWRGLRRLIKFDGCEQEKDKQRFKGKPDDLKGFDELADFLESQYEFIIGWNRSADPNQRCRVAAATNPPTTAEGQWIVKRWAAWLDPKHPNPAKDGELRWYLTVDGVEFEVDGPGPHKVEGRPKPIKATSRTFIRSGLADNPDLADTDYDARLEAMPEEMRRAYRDGDFTVGQKDGDFQLIPTSWIIAAQDRWTEDGWQEFQMTAMALDPAGGGKDAEELAMRHGGWYAPLVTRKGKETADANAGAGQIISYRRDRAAIVVDVGGGYGGGITLRLKDNEIEFVAFNGANKSTAKDKSGKLGFLNKRAEAWWRFRESLDPSQEGGSVIALPADAELRADLAAPTWKLTKGGIVIEDKDSLRKRLGRSPGKGDVVVMCLSEGDRAVMRSMRLGLGHGSSAEQGIGRRMPQVIGGKPARRR